MKVPPKRQAREGVKLDFLAKHNAPIGMDSYAEIIAALRAARALLGLSQESVAALAGVSRQMVVRVENGETNVSTEAVEAIRLALEGAGAVFLPGSLEHGPAAALRRYPR